VRHGIDALLPQSRRKRSDSPIDDPLVRSRIDWAQRVVAGQNLEIRHTLSRYAMLTEKQRRLLRVRRDALVARPPPKAIAAAPGRACGARLHRCAVGRAPRAVADLRESIHMMRLAAAIRSRIHAPLGPGLRDLWSHLDEKVGLTLLELEKAGDDADLAAVGLKGPSATWTYLVGDNPFEGLLAACSPATASA